MTSEIDSSLRRGSSGPRPMISSVICSSIRTRSARVRARPSSSMTLPKISSIWRRTSTWFDRSSLGSRSWMTRLWILNLTSRNDSRTGAWVIRRWDGVGGRPPERAGPPHSEPLEPRAPAQDRPPVERSRSSSGVTSHQTPYRPVGQATTDMIIGMRTTTSSERLCAAARPPGRRPVRPPPQWRAEGRPGRPGPPGLTGRRVRPD